MKYFFFTAIVFLLFSCNGNEKINPGDSAAPAVVKKDSAVSSIQLPRRDTFFMDKAKCAFNCTRSKTVKDVDKEIKIGHSVMRMKMDNASFSASTKIEIADAFWETSSTVLDQGNVTLDMTSVKTLQIGEDEKITSGNPGYLEIKKYPTALLAINSFDSIPGKPGRMQVTAHLTIKDTTAEITFPAKVEFANAAHPEVPSKLTGNFHIDGVKWGLNPKNAKVIKDDLLFEVILVTK